ncbi:MAG: hypothetical protein IT376_05530 [Polyangiaceae bacterium]|nr:hypothetical protein [Polyangiaceae bacterium]
MVNGNAKRVTADLIAMLDRVLDGGDVFVSRRLEDGPDIARVIVDRGYGTVLTGGGDGTFTVVVTDVVGEARRRGAQTPRFGLLKLGTGNALAWVVGAGAGGRELEADVRRLQREAGSRSLRLVECEGYLAPFAGFGADAVMLADYSATRARLSRTPLRRFAAGPLGYAVAATTRTLPSYVVRPQPHFRVVNLGAPARRVLDGGASQGPEIAAGEVIYEGPARVASVATIPYFGFGFRFFPYADERDDRMHLRISTITSARLVANFPAIWRGDFDDPSVAFDYLVEAVRIESSPESPFQIGGDPQGVRAAVELRLTPEPIRLVDHYSPPSST